MRASRSPLLIITAIVSTVGCAAPRGAVTPSAEAEPDASARLLDVDGNVVGVVTFTTVEKGVLVEAGLEGLGGDPGFRGFHIHENADCDPEHPEGPFMGAGGHWSPQGLPHGEHEGDLPSLLVLADGSAHASFVTDRFTVDSLLASGVAVLLHGDKDNFAHIPDRYRSEAAEEPGPDEDTLATGDAGGRAACGIVEEAARPS